MKKAPAIALFAALAAARVFWSGPAVASQNGEVPAAPPDGAETRPPAAGNEAEEEAAKDFAKDVRPLLELYCWDCHGDGADKGGLNMDDFTDEASVLAARKIWSGVQFHLEQWTMPPEKRDQPTPEEREFLVKYLDHLLNPVDPNNPDPGRVTIRRLNRVEYNNTTRDLLGVDVRPADEFPEDDTGYGFDNIGDVLSLPPILMERYLVAADRVLEAALPPGPPPAQKIEYGPGDLHGVGLPTREYRLLAFNGVSHTEFVTSLEGEYEVRVKVWADQAGDVPARAELRLPREKGAEAVADVTATTAEEAQTLSLNVWLGEGAHRLEIGFFNDFYDPDIPDPEKRDRNLYVGGVEIEGPVRVKETPLNDVMRRYFAAGEGLGETREGARAVLEAFAGRAFRRTVKPEELDRLLRIYHRVREAGEDHREALRTGMKATLVSPHFIYRLAPQPEPDNPALVVEIDEFALASRLSYWLWSTMPDDELLDLARRGELRKNLHDQTRRMLRDPRARALAENFGGQWLELRSLAVAAPDSARFPEYTPALRDAMRRETEELFFHIIRENLPVTELLGANYTFLNQRLAEFYGVPGVTGEEFRKVELDPSTGRRGVLTHAGVLTVTSDPTRTSPVKRGKWVLENMLGIIPPPPPPNVPPLEESGHGALTGTVRQRLEQHRSNPGCASCHALIDPIGFGLENFDPIGRWRDTDGGAPVDSSGVLTTGQKFSNAKELAEVLLTDRRDTFLRALVSKMLTYALGRGVEPYDRPAVDGILARMRAEGETFESLVLGIVDSVPFQKRRGDSWHTREH